MARFRFFPRHTLFPVKLIASHGFYFLPARQGVVFFHLFCRCIRSEVSPGLVMIYRRWYLLLTLTSSPDRFLGIQRVSNIWYITLKHHVHVNK